jgi:VanZ family protein
VAVTLRADAVRRAWLAAGWFGIGLVVFLSLTPRPPEIDLGAYTDKWEHVTTYALLMWWFCQVRTSLSARARTGLGLVALGIGLEFAQRMTGFRMFEVSDMVADTLGVALGWLLAPSRTPNLLSWCQRWMAPSADPPRS